MTERGKIPRGRRQSHGARVAVAKTWSAAVRRQAYFQTAYTATSSSALQGVPSSASRSALAWRHVGLVKSPSGNTDSHGSGPRVPNAHERNEGEHWRRLIIGGVDYLTVRGVHRPTVARFFSWLFRVLHGWTNDNDRRQSSSQAVKQSNSQVRQVRQMQAVHTLFRRRVNHSDRSLYRTDRKKPHVPIMCVPKWNPTFPSPRPAMGIGPEPIV